MVFIKDGEGQGKLLGIDEKNRAKVTAVSRDAEEDAAQEGKSFIIHARCHTSALANGGLIAIKNIGKVPLAFSRLLFDAFTLTQPLIISIVKNPILIGGTPLVPGHTRKTYGALADPEIDVIVSDAAADLTFTLPTSTDQPEYHSFILASGQSKIRDMRGTNILSKNSVLLIGFEAETGVATDAEIISVSLNFYETKLRLQGQ